MRTVASVFFVIASSALAAEGPAATMGHGMTSCAEFAKLYRENPIVTETVHFVWAQGFMSGLNMMQLALKRPMHNLNAWSLRDQQSRIRHFCEEKPLSEFIYAVQDLFSALPPIPPQSN